MRTLSILFIAILVATSLTANHKRKQPSIWNKFKNSVKSSKDQCDNWLNEFKQAATEITNQEQQKLATLEKIAKSRFLKAKNAIKAKQAQFNKNAIKWPAAQRSAAKKWVKEAQAKAQEMKQRMEKMYAFMKSRLSVKKPAAKGRRLGMIDQATAKVQTVADKIKQGILTAKTNELPKLKTYIESLIKKGRDDYKAMEQKFKEKLKNTPKGQRRHTQDRFDLLKLTISKCKIEMKKIENQLKSEVKKELKKPKAPVKKNRRR